MQKALILIVDENQATRTMYADYLRHHGYAVVEADGTGMDVELSESLRPDLVVTELPSDWEWLQAIRVMRGDGTTRHCVIIACSTHIEPDWPCAPPGLEVDRALPKPTSPRALLQEVQQLLGHVPTEAVMA
jgi:CheY-like chemotaxis protein